MATRKCLPIALPVCNLQSGDWRRLEKTRAHVHSSIANVTLPRLGSVCPLEGACLWSCERLPYAARRLPLWLPQRETRQRRTTQSTQAAPALRLALVLAPALAPALALLPPLRPRRATAFIAGTLGCADVGVAAWTFTLPRHPLAIGRGTQPMAALITRPTISDITHWLSSCSTAVWAAP